MSTITFDWVVESKDPASQSMVVKYTPKDAPHAARSLNIPIPAADADVNAHVGLYAPTADWQRMLNPEQQHAEIAVGHGGEHSIDTASMTPAASESPQTVGDWQEEYIRALIYQVLEEIREQQA